MKRLLRVVAVIGGLAGVAWAMRERLISIAAPREDKPPTFRVVSDGHQPHPPPAN
ncbi:MAG: hypothetical protein Q8Q52_08775 [Acidimicrobiia bacterium]|nr:hypothetical protein [Acidimicrobiia bacterium]